MANPVIDAYLKHEAERQAQGIPAKPLDPACGTGGFLVESYDYLKKQRNTAADEDRLQNLTLFGIEKKPAYRID